MRCSAAECLFPAKAVLAAMACCTTQCFWRWMYNCPNPPPNSGRGGGLVGATTLSSIPHWWCHLVATLIAQSTWIHVTNNSVFHHQVCIYYHIDKCQYLPRQIYKCLYLPSQKLTNVYLPRLQYVRDGPEKWLIDRPPPERPVKKVREK